MIPDNDECSGAIDLASLPATVTAQTCLASTDDTGFCGTSAPGLGVWYTVTGTGNLLIASTCKSGSDFDTKIQVFTGSCDKLVCTVAPSHPIYDVQNLCPHRLGLVDQVYNCICVIAQLEDYGELLSDIYLGAGGVGVL